MCALPVNVVTTNFSLLDRKSSTFINILFRRFMQQKGQASLGYYLRQLGHLCDVCRLKIRSFPSPPLDRFGFVWSLYWNYLTIQAEVNVIGLSQILIFKKVPWPEGGMERRKTGITIYSPTLFCREIIWLKRVILNTPALRERPPRIEPWWP